MLAGIWHTLWGGSTTKQHFRAVGLGLILLVLLGYALVASRRKLRNRDSAERWAANRER